MHILIIGNMTFEIPDGTIVMENPRLGIELEKPKYNYGYIFRKA